MYCMKCENQIKLLPSFKEGAYSVDLVGIVPNVQGNHNKWKRYYWSSLIYFSSGYNMMVSVSAIPHQQI